jgi:hypothetical protein
MATVIGPLHSDEAHGTYAGAMVFCLRYGRQYVRMRVVPRDPQTPAQLAHREVIRAAGAAWRALSPAEREQWNARAAGTPMHGYALFVRSQCADANRASSSQSAASSGADVPACVPASRTSGAVVSPESY